MHPVFQSLLELQARWKLGNPEMAALCHVEERVFAEWMRGQAPATPATIPPGTQSAVSLLSIARNLALRYPETEKQVAWLTEPHDDFERHKPLEVALSSPENLQWLAYYLESSARASAPSN